MYGSNDNNKCKILKVDRYNNSPSERRKLMRNKIKEKKDELQEKENQLILRENQLIQKEANLFLKEAILDMKEREINNIAYEKDKLLERLILRPIIIFGFPKDWDGSSTCCGCLIVSGKQDNMKFLMVREENKGKNKRGGWGAPKGQLEFGENIVECAIRETKEEANIDIDINDLNHSFIYLIYSENVRYIYFCIVNYDKQIPQFTVNDEISDRKWITYDEVVKRKKYVFYTTYKTALHLRSITEKPIYISSLC